MIWLKEKKKIVGYVPILKKEYSEQEIREMSKYKGYQGWSTLSILVMQIQGIGYEDYDYSYPRLLYSSDAKRLVDVSFFFQFECFSIPNNPIMEQYIPQIFKVFENLTFYKVEEYSIEQMRRKTENAKKEIEQLISEKTLNYINNDIKNFLLNVEETTKKLTDLQKLFKSKGYKLNHSLFESANPEILNQIYEQRETKITLKN